MLPRQSIVVYTGKEQKPVVIINNGFKQLVEEQDFIIQYKNSVNAGTVTITITGKGNYLGTVKKTFAINRIKPALSFASASVSKKTTDSAFTNKLTKKTDGTVTFKSSNTAIATVGKTNGKVTIKGAGTGRRWRCPGEWIHQHQQLPDYEHHGGWR